MTSGGSELNIMRKRTSRSGLRFVLVSLTLAIAVSLSSCSGDNKRVQASGPMVTVGVTKVVKKSLGTSITLSSELVPFQEIDVYAK